MPPLQGLDDAEDGIIRIVPGQGAAQGGADLELLGLEEEAAGCGKRMAAHVFAQRVDGQAGVNLGLVGIAHQAVEEAADLAHVAGHLGHALFASIQFLQDHHGQVDVMLLETVEGRGIVHQHIGVQDE